MDAVEFVKKFGVDEARRVLLKSVGCYSVWLWGEYHFHTIDIKRLVESHELVEKCGGVERSKGYMQVCFYKGRDTYGNRLKQAITDVEACQ